MKSLTIVDPTRARRAVRRLGRQLVPLLPWLAGAFGLCLLALDAMRRPEGGEPAFPLDDAYIHLQYARSWFELHPFAYQAQAEPSAGMTSILWPLALAMLRGLSFGLIDWWWLSFGAGFVLLGLLAHQTWLLGRGVLHPHAALAGGLSTLAFGAHTWFAASGMEVLLLALLLLTSARLLSEWWEESTPPGRLWPLLALTALLPLARPEGSLVAVLVAGSLTAKPRGRSRAWALLALGSVLGPSLIYTLFTGQATSTTATAKWLALNPYYDADRLLLTLGSHARLLFGTLFDGRWYSPMFLPSGYAWLSWLALPALVANGVLGQRPTRALLITAVALGVLIPTTYETFLVNRLRYLWPFAAAWLIALMALPDLCANLLARLQHVRRYASGGRLALAAALLSGLLWKQPATLADLAESSHAIARQQVAIAGWARRHLPPNAYLGVNDAGAIAFFGERRTFDVVGLTSAGEATYWSAGPGSRFEHYERLPRAALPSHFIVYPEWFAIDPLLGELLTERVVYATILGGSRMAVHRADLSVLGSAELPARPPAGQRLIDRLDVADLDSEAAHAYALLRSNREANRVVRFAERVDGGRAERNIERFRLALMAGGRLIARLAAERELTVEVHLRDRHGSVLLGRPALDTGVAWDEVELQIPAATVSGQRSVEVRALGTAAFTALHYWSYAPGGRTTEGGPE